MKFTFNSAYIAALAVLCFFSVTDLSAENDDLGNYTFKSPRPLVTYSEMKNNLSNAWGGEMIISNNGFGIGLFYQHIISENLYFFGSLYMSGARNTDERELWDYQQNNYVIPGKINRLFMFPLTFGVQQYIFTKELSESMRPYFSLGIGPTFVLKAPYNDYEFFDALGHANGYIRPSAFLGLGTNVSVTGNSFLSLNLRYYYIPFGGDGIESVKGSPIKDMGGLFLSISMGVKFE